MDTLFIEIGAEEIPAGYIEPALSSFENLLTQKLSAARIACGAVTRYGTPRRLALCVADVADSQAELTTEVIGPPESVGFDASGAPTQAAAKFAEKVGVPVGRLRIADTPRGRYVCADKSEASLTTLQILPTLLPDIISSISFPKRMKWGTLDVSFARPIHWILALLGGQVIPFRFGDIESGNRTYGHRFMHPQAIAISHPDAYRDALRKAYVIADKAERRDWVIQAIETVASQQGGRILPDAELVDTVNNLIEYPAVTAGKFDAGFLEIPDEVLITAMREHQKYFSVVDANGRLMNCFVVVNNTPVRDMDLVARGHERVLRARLSDARFFFRADAATPMTVWIDKLKKVLFQARLGTVHDKIVRVVKLSEYLAEAISPGTELSVHAARAALFCKADLVSQVVVEFTKLQGIMGRIYASLAGEHADVAQAIEEHYRPTFSGGPLPKTRVGAVVAIADKMDSICGCFSVGRTPTGASDPYALRRQGIGLLQILGTFGFEVSLSELIRTGVALFADISDADPKQTAEAVFGFLKSRLNHILEEDGYARDVIAAVTDLNMDSIPQARLRVSALQNLKSAPDFEPLAVAFKRVVNIIRKSEADPKTDPRALAESLFENPSETALLRACEDAESQIAPLIAAGDYARAFQRIAALKNPVDGFFDSVMVMAEDTRVRNNRLALLKRIADLFDRFADFSKIST